MTAFWRCLSASLFLPAVLAYNNGVGRLPPMGWNSWCTADACGATDICSEELILTVANAIKVQGLDKLGYQYMNLDDCWSAHDRAPDGQLQPGKERFPNGMKYVADQLHSMGLKLGLYTCVGTQTCRDGRPGSYGYYQQDANTLASWGVDFIKADNCHRPSNESGQSLYTQFSQAINATGRPIVFSLCNWGEEAVNTWGGTVGQMWRFQMDHLPLWHFPPQAAGEGLGQGTRDIIEYMATLSPAQYVSEYAFMDPDFIMTLFPSKAAIHTLPFVDSRTEFSFWSLWSAPLLISTDPINMNDEFRSIVANPSVIAIDQDELTVPGELLQNTSEGGHIWSKPLFNQDQAVIFYNPHDARKLTISVSWAALGWSNSDQVTVYDLWNTKIVGTFDNGITEDILPHDVFYFRAINTALGSPAARRSSGDALLEQLLSKGHTALRTES